MITLQSNMYSHFCSDDDDDEIFYKLFWWLYCYWPTIRFLVWCLDFYTITWVVTLLKNIINNNFFTAIEIVRKLNFKIRNLRIFSIIIQFLGKVLFLFWPEKEFLCNSFLIIMIMTVERGGDKRYLSRYFNMHAFNL